MRPVMKPSKPEGDDSVVLEREPKTKWAKRYAVVFYNDDYTTKWFVVHVLEHFFYMNETTAMNFMMAVHRKGKGAAGVYSREIAETKAQQVSDYAKEFKMPLLVTAEPEDDGDTD